MTKITNLIALISSIIFLISCAPSEKDWHTSAAKMGAKSIYIKKDGSFSISRRVKDKTLIKYFDTNGNDIQQPEEEIDLNINPSNPLSDPYKHPSALRNQIFTSEQRENISFDYSGYAKKLEAKE